MKKTELFCILLFLITSFSGCGESIDFYNESESSVFSSEESEEDDDNDFFYESETEIITEAVETVEMPEFSEISVRECHKDQMSAEDREIYNIMYESLMSCENIVTLNVRLTNDKISYIFDCLIDDYPEIFWVKNGYTATTFDNSTEVEFVSLEKVNKTNFTEYGQKLEEQVQNIIDLIPETYSLYEKILFVHDYLVENTEYATDYSSISDIESEFYYTPYGCLVEHRAVCSGYTKAFQIIMHRLGVTCGNVIGFSNKTGENHTWNYVEYEGEYYWIDVTWDDPVFIADFDYSSNGNISHAYFFITSDELLRTHSINYEDSLFVPECTATEYNYMRYVGNYVQEYSFEEFDRMFSDGNGNLTVQFGNSEAFFEAMNDLIYNSNIYNTMYAVNNSVGNITYVSDEEMYILEIKTE